MGRQVDRRPLEGEAPDGLERCSRDLGVRADAVHLVGIPGESGGPVPHATIADLAAHLETSGEARPELAVVAGEPDAVVAAVPDLARLGATAVAVLSAGFAEQDAAGRQRQLELVRRTREHPDLRVGSSVRGAIDAAAVVASLAELRGRPTSVREVGLDAVLVALSGRVRLREGSLRTSEEILTELYDEVFGPPDEDGAEPGDRADEAGAPPPAGKAPAPPGPHRS